ncbi:MAG: 30S ribosome-binding factor RbfA [Myxococcota bacterium]|jgi:ribosome-binding factor A|nr:30S ribosome-binding factor RbfA [Myxococcota bacterium]
MASRRIERVSAQLRRELAQLLLTQSKDVRLNQVQITEVKVTPDLQQASVYWVCLDPALSKTLGRVLGNAAGFMRTELAQRLALRVAPKLLFRHDEAPETGRKMEQLLSELRATGGMGADGDEDEPFRQQEGETAQAPNRQEALDGEDLESAEA